MLFRARLRSAGNGSACALGCVHWRSMNNPYQAFGNRESVLGLVERFYDIMERTAPALAALHEMENGKISRGNRDRFGLFLVGWLGGPDDYVRQHGHPRLRMRHMRVAVDTAMRDAWLRCMFAALEEQGLDDATQRFLRQRLTEVADFLRNVDEAPQG